MASRRDNGRERRMPSQRPSVVDSRDQGRSARARYERHAAGSDVSAYSRSSYGAHAANGSRNAGNGVYGGDYNGGYTAGGYDAASSADKYSRRTSVAYYQAKRQKGGRQRTVLKVILGVLIALLVTGVAAAGLYLHNLNASLHGNADAEAQAALTNASLREPFYVLILGVDRSQERDDSGEFGDAYRSDTMILARVDPVDKKVTLISIERDTLVDMGEYGVQKINSAHAFGGIAFAIQVVSEYAGVPIAHYVEVDFDGFEAIVDALGGVTVDVPITIDDYEADGYVEAGTQTLSGAEALTLCRSRHAYDEVGGGDYYRAANQRMVIGACVHQLLNSDPATMLNTVSVLCKYVTTDMSAQDIATVALAMVGMDTDTDIYSSMNPTYSYYDGEGWYEYTVMESWTAMMSRVDQGLSPTINAADSANRGGVTDGTINPEYVANSVLNDTSLGDAPAQPRDTDPYGVTVLNGSGVAGAAGSVAQGLRDNGWTVADENVGNADSQEYTTTVIVYGETGNSDDAEMIAEYMGAGMILPDDGTYQFYTSYLVIVGQDY